MAGFSQDCPSNFKLHLLNLYQNNFFKMEQVGRTLIIIGIILIIAGLIVYFAGNRLGWLGHLPGDIRIVKENVRIYIPVTTMILISVVLSLLIWLIRKLL